VLVLVTGIGAAALVSVAFHDYVLSPNRPLLFPTQGQGGPFSSSAAVGRPGGLTIAWPDFAEADSRPSLIPRGGDIAVVPQLRPTQDLWNAGIPVVRPRRGWRDLRNIGDVQDLRDLRGLLDLRNEGSLVFPRPTTQGVYWRPSPWDPRCPHPHPLVLAMAFAGTRKEALELGTKLGESCKQDNAISTLGCKECCDKGCLNGTVSYYLIYCEDACRQFCTDDAFK